MDLSTIKKNIENGLIRTTAEFQRDIMLMFQNAVMYNSSDHDVYHMAVEMQRDVLEQIQVKAQCNVFIEQHSDLTWEMLIFLGQWPASFGIINVSLA